MPLHSDKYKLAVSTLETCLAAEAIFFDRLEEQSRGDDVDALRNEATFHIGRFFFLLKAFGCTSEAALGRFVEAHNQAVIAAQADAPPKRKKELGKAVFTVSRLLRLQAYFRATSGAAFGVTDLADLLFAQMTRTRALNHIEVLRSLGLLRRQEIDLIHGATGPGRTSAEGSLRSTAEVIVSDGVLEDTYQDYLLAIRSGIVGETELAVDMVS